MSAPRHLGAVPPANQNRTGCRDYRPARSGRGPCALITVPIVSPAEVLPAVPERALESPALPVPERHVSRRAVWTRQAHARGG
jgi:hypothetical protein